MTKKGRGQLCTYCRRRMESKGGRGRCAATKDHVVPKSKGGSGPWSRTVWCCRQCNEAKKDMMPDEWSSFMAANPGWWRKTRTAPIRSDPSYFSVLGLRQGADAKEIARAFWAKALAAHPDVGGTHDAMIKLNGARDEALRMQGSGS